MDVVSSVVYGTCVQSASSQQACVAFRTLSVRVQCVGNEETSNRGPWLGGVENLLTWI